MKRLLVGLLLFVGMIVLFTSMSYADPGYLYGFDTTYPNESAAFEIWTYSQDISVFIMSSLSYPLFYSFLAYNFAYKTAWARTRDLLTLSVTRAMELITGRASLTVISV